MKLRTAAAVLMATSVAASSHQRHQQFHQKKRSVDVAGSNLVVRDTATVLMYSYNGQLLDENALCAGLEDGSIEWVGSEPPRPSCGNSASAPVPGPAVGGAVFDDAPAASASASVASSSASVSASASGSGFDLDNSNTDKEFPDGQISCSEFPSDYGAIAIPWINLGGWSGIQYASYSNGFISHLASPDPDQGGCKPSSDGQTTFCSYACPAGFQKSQWPTAQGSDEFAVSAGGLKCGEDGKLYLTNSALSTKLCMRGTDSLTIVNKLGQGAAVCRTDYPGTEAETVPVFAAAGAEIPLTCPDSAQYYTHLGKPTTAHYYVNDAGVPVNKACQWGEDQSLLGQSYGNWAPIVIGAGKDNNGATWLSIQSSCQNNPEICNDLSYSIELEGDFGGDNACFYTQSSGVGHWCSKGSLATFDPNSPNCQTKATTTVPGCTVQLLSGKASYNFVATS